MKWFKRFLVLSLVLLWVPATLHCELEELPGLQFLSCCDHGEAAPHQDDDCATDACAVLESGLYKTANPKIAVAPPATVLLFELPELPATHLDADGVRIQQLMQASPDLPVTWQFSLRTALPPRAPSFVS